VTSFSFRETQAGKTTKSLRRGPASVATRFAPPSKAQRVAGFSTQERFMRNVTPLSLGGSYGCRTRRQARC
jgi:hypothetical protein